MKISTKYNTFTNTHRKTEEKYEDKTEYCRFLLRKSNILIRTLRKRRWIFFQIFSSLLFTSVFMFMTSDSLNCSVSVSEDSQNIYNKWWQEEKILCHSCVVDVNKTKQKQKHTTHTINFIFGCSLQCKCNKLDLRKQKG